MSRLTLAKISIFHDLKRLHWCLYLAVFLAENCRSYESLTKHFFFLTKNIYLKHAKKGEGE